MIVSTLLTKSLYICNRQKIYLYCDDCEILFADKYCIIGDHPNGNSDNNTCNNGNNGNNGDKKAILTIMAVTARGCLPSTY